jgi:hypothetical protein
MQGELLNFCCWICKGKKNSSYEYCSQFEQLLSTCKKRLQCWSKSRWNQIRETAKINLPNQSGRRCLPTIHGSRTKSNLCMKHSCNKEVSFRECPTLQKKKHATELTGRSWLHLWQMHNNYSSSNLLRDMDCSKDIHRQHLWQLPYET